MKQEVVKIFNDLEALHDFCRFELMPFNEADLYNRSSYVWRAFENSKRPRKPWNGDRKPRGEYNRSGNNYRNHNRQ